MSLENVETARRILDAVGRRDVSLLLGLTDPEIEWRSFFAALLEGGEYHGHDGMRRYVDDLNEAWDYLRADFDDVLDAGDVVIGLGRIHYRGKGSGVEGSDPAGWMFKFRDGKVHRFRAFREPHQWLESLGDRP